jgi:hypothetical protein
MKIYPKFIVFCAAALITAFAAPAETFEGTMQMVFATPTLQNEATGFIKGLSFRVQPKTYIQTNGVEGYPIIDFAAKKFFIVAPKEKYYLTLPLAQLEAPIDKAAVKVKASGKTDSILGHPVEEWVLDDPSSKIAYSVWLTRDFKAPFNIFISLQKTAPVEGLTLGRMAKILIAQGMFPLGATAKDASGKVTLEMRVLAIDPGKVDAKDVAIPEGFAKMSDVLKTKK